MYSRPPKANHLETIWYEIDMLQFCYERLHEPRLRGGDPGDFYVYLEAFLLHYCSLIEFFADHCDVKVSDIRECSERTVSEDEFGTIANTTLYEEHWGPISRYLQRHSRIDFEGESCLARST